MDLAFRTYFLPCKKKKKVQVYVESKYKGDVINLFRRLQLPGPEQGIVPNTDVCSSLSLGDTILHFGYSIYWNFSLFQIILRNV